MHEDKSLAWPQRLAWLAALWLAGVSSLALVAALLKLALNAAGLTA